MTGRTVVLKFVDVRWKKYCAVLKVCRNEFSGESVHDLRVAMRRLLAMLDVLRSVIHHSHIKKIRRALKDQLNDLNELRDVQVQLADIFRFVDDVPNLNIFREYLQKKERKLLRVVHKRVKSIKLGGLSKRMEKVKSMIESLPEQTFEGSLYESLDNAYARAIRYYTEINMERPATIHRLRVAFKKFRYMTEIIHPQLRKFPSGNVQKMHDYQGMMGDIQDMQVVLQQMNDLADSYPASDLSTIQSHYTARLKQCLLNYLEKKEELLTFWRIASDQPFPWEN